MSAAKTLVEASTHYLLHGGVCAGLPSAVGYNGAIVRWKDVCAMRWASAVSDQFSLGQAVIEACGKVSAGLQGAPPDLCIVFVSAHHSPEFEDVAPLVHQALRPKALIGCSGGGVIGGGAEVEDRAGFSVTAATLPGVDIRPFAIQDSAMPSPDASPAAWEELLGAPASAEPHLILLPDPFTIRADHLLTGLDYAYPKGAKIGGLSSGGTRPGGNALFMGETVHREGAVGVALSGNITVDTVVAQGCRPIGAPMVVTRCQRNVVLEMGGLKPMDALRDIYEHASDRDRNLLSTALHLGVITDPLKEEAGPGDFLIRNVMGLDRESGGLVVGELLNEGQLVQFHLRDAQTAAEDMDTMLRRYAQSHTPEQGAGALLFSCLGRGMHLFGRPDHDTNMFRQAVGTLPLGGVFCNGEIGQVGFATYLHGFTSSFGIFRPRAA